MHFVLPDKQQSLYRLLKETRLIVLSSRFIASTTQPGVRLQWRVVWLSQSAVNLAVPSVVFSVRSYWLGERNEGLHSILRLVLLCLRYAVLLTLLCPKVWDRILISVVHCRFLESFRSCNLVNETSSTRRFWSIFSHKTSLFRNPMWSNDKPIQSTCGS